jgi:hypothetical protein
VDAALRGGCLELLHAERDTVPARVNDAVRTRHGPDPGGGDYRSSLLADVTGAPVLREQGTGLTATARA